MSEESIVKFIAVGVHIVVGISFAVQGNWPAMCLSISAAYYASYFRLED